MQSLTKSSKKLYQDYKNKIIDILLFGSIVKSKFKISDIDIAIILKNVKEIEILNLMKNISLYYKNEKIHLNLLLVENILNNPLFKTLLEEGVSLIDNKPLHVKLGYNSGSIFSLNLTKLSKSKKVLFSYALHDKKDKKGILHRFNGKEIGRAVFFIPIDFIDEFKEFLEIWNVDYYVMKVLKS